MTNLPNIAEIASPVVAAGAAYATYLSTLPGRRVAQEQREPMLAGSAFQRPSAIQAVMRRHSLRSLTMAVQRWSRLKRSKQDPVRASPRLEEAPWVQARKLV